MSVRSVAGGVAVDVTGAWGASLCDTGIDSSDATYDSNCVFGDTRSVDEIICRNAIVGLEYTLHHSQDEQSTIVNVTVELVVGDVVFDALYPVSSAQSFGIAFVDSADSSATSQSNGNLVSRYGAVTFNNIDVY
jgi:hypothetical protein